jgi:hypothetical protein
MNRIFKDSSRRPLQSEVWACFEKADGKVGAFG